MAEKLMNHSTTQNTWYRRCYRRLLVDMHIPDWDEKFLSQLDAKKYVETIAKGKIQSTMLYCNSHVGLALYPSKVGPVHKALKGGDFVGDVLRECSKRGIATVAYYSAIFNNVAFLGKPSWRIKPHKGGSVYKQSRYGVCCPNSPYMDFAVKQTEEICREYPFDGIFFDMLFWPYVCYCPHCRAKFKKEEGKELPAVINWNNATWVSFQRARERWMSEAAALLTDAVRRTRPSMTVTHQMSPVLHDWRLAMPFSLTDHCDYTSGDFYGPAIQQSLVCKLFGSLSQKKPFEFHTSRSLDLRDHVTMKTPLRLETQASLAPAHSSAFMFIDGIEPAGKLIPGVYKRIGSIFSKMASYEKYLGGELDSEVAIYMSSESRFDFRENGLSVDAYSVRGDNMAPIFTVPHMDAVKGVAQSLQEAHIPYTVIARQNLSEISKYKVLVLPNVLLMDDEEIKTVRNYVKNGGTIYVSGHSSFVDGNGRVRRNFGLGDVLGITAKSRMTYDMTFIEPSDLRLKKVIFPQSQLIHKTGWIEIEANKASVLATFTPAWYPENEGTVLKPSFASIHSTPPAAETSNLPAMTRHKYGQGVAYYVAATIEAENQSINREVVSDMIRIMLKKSPKVEADAPKYVEITAFSKSLENRTNISLVSLNDSSDCVPCSGKIRFTLDKGKKIVSIKTLPSEEDIPFHKLKDGRIEFDFSDFTTFNMFQVEYK